ncbi:hypothetical protein [uncultured Gordonia sp.]|uniref:hypothetical protein n=1 Tax=uncultured Gordonia sp. TaxID=198437 RepID=UPI0025868685|nr:hypothetical protein [uncultured Gordonia sp.]
MSSDEFYDGVTALPAWAEAWLAQQRAAHRQARGEHLPGGDTWQRWERELASDGE